MGASTMKITTVGIDLAKNVFQVHAIRRQRHVVDSGLLDDKLKSSSGPSRPKS
jgi:hypothetical protein